MRDERMWQSDLVFHGNRVPRHVDALDGSEGSKGLSDGVLTQLIVYGAHIHPTHDGQCTLPLSCHLPTRENNT